MYVMDLHGGGPGRWCRKRTSRCLDSIPAWISDLGEVPSAHLEQGCSSPEIEKKKKKRGSAMWVQEPSSLLPEPHQERSWLMATGNLSKWWWGHQEHATDILTLWDSRNSGCKDKESRLHRVQLSPRRQGPQTQAREMWVWQAEF